MNKGIKEGNKGITLIALVITIIVLLILVAISISTLMGENGILTKATDAKERQSHASIKEGISLAYSEWIMQQKTGNKEDIQEMRKVASTVVTKVAQTTTSNKDVGTFREFLTKKKYIDNATGIINTEALVGNKTSLGNGTETNDVYKFEEQEGKYVVNYYNKKGTASEIWSVETDREEEYSYFVLKGYPIEDCIDEQQELDITLFNIKDYFFEKITDEDIIAGIQGYDTFEDLIEEWYQTEKIAQKYSTLQELYFAMNEGGTLGEYQELISRMRAELLLQDCEITITDLTGEKRDVRDDFYQCQYMGTIPYKMGEYIFSIEGNLLMENRQIVIKTKLKVKIDRYEVVETNDGRIFVCDMQEKKSHYIKNVKYYLSDGTEVPIDTQNIEEEPSGTWSVLREESEWYWKLPVGFIKLVFECKDVIEEISGYIGISPVV